MFLVTNNMMLLNEIYEMFVFFNLAQAFQMVWLLVIIFLSVVVINLFP